MLVNVNPINQFLIDNLKDGSNLQIKSIVQANEPSPQQGATMRQKHVVAPQQYVLPLKNGSIDLMAMMLMMQL